MIDSSCTEMPVTVLDLSDGGFRLSCDELLEPGEKFRLRSAQGEEFPATILWVRGGEAGGTFQAPIDWQGI